jgi:hypothetical protein
MAACLPPHASNTHKHFSQPKKIRGTQLNNFDKTTPHNMNNIIPDEKRKPKGPSAAI